MTMAPTTTQETLADVVSRNIRTLMALRGISGVRLAAEVGISQTGVSKRLRGVTPFDLGDLERFSDVLGVRPIDLLDPELLGRAAATKLPRRDSNLQPAGYGMWLVSPGFRTPLGNRRTRPRIGRSVESPAAARLTPSVLFGGSSDVHERSAA